MQIKNKRKLCFCTILLLLFVCALAVSATDVETNITLTASANSLTFTSSVNADYYIVRAFSRGTTISDSTGVEVKSVQAVSGQSTYTANYANFTNLSQFKSMLSAGYVTFRVYAYDDARVVLSAPVLTISGTTVSWAAVEHADKYGVYITSASSGETVVLATISTTSYDLSSLAVGTYNIYVSAASLDIDNYLPSDNSAPVQYSKTVQLAAPANVSINGYVISWSSVENNSGYRVVYRKVSGDGSIYQTYDAAQNVTQHTVSVTTGGEYSISVITLGTGNYTNSEESACVNYTPKLAAPSIFLSNSPTYAVVGRVMWGDVSHATSYSADLFNSSGDLISTLDATSGVMPSLVLGSDALSSGSYSIKVKASADGYISSDYSNALDCTVYSTPAPVISVSGTTVSWTDDTVSHTIYVVKDGEPEWNDNVSAGVTSYDFSSLADGTYTVRLVANGSEDSYFPLVLHSRSEYSNTVTFTKSSTPTDEGYDITFSNVAYDSTYYSYVYIQINGTGDWISILNDGDLLEYVDVRYFYIYYTTDAPDVYMALLNNDGGYPDMEDTSLSQYDISSSVSAATATKVIIDGQSDIVVTVFENG